MVGGISKRQQYRNERALQDLIRSVPGNDRCADCQAMNPGWASWNMGIFLCMRCAAIHRKLGTHISKVKSLSMDSWTDDQVDNMKSHGNNIMNKIFNPKNVKPPVPTDVDEADSCMERFIRQKYQHRSLDENKQHKPPSRHDSGYDRSPEGSPPPLPPKPARPFGFGLRSASSATNLNRISNRSAFSPQSDRFDSPSPALGVRKTSGDASFDSKLATLRDMGFTNERRNAIALRELNGNLDKTIETLVRLGEGNGSAVRPSASASTPSVDSSKFGNPFDQLDSRPAAQPSSNFNPFDAQPPQQPQQQQQQQQQQQFPQSASMQPLEQSFQGLQVAQPLFPHSTGGYPYRQSSLPQPLYQQAAVTPPATSTLNQSGYVSSPQILDGGNNPFFQTGAQPQASMTASVANPNLNVAPSNPFFGQVSSQPTSMQAQNQVSSGPFGPPRHANTMPIMSATSPFGQPSPFQQQPQQPQQPQQQHTQPQLQVPSMQAGQNTMNPYQMMNAPAAPQSTGYPAPSQYGYQMPAQHQYAQPTGRVDKNSILALYNLSPQPPTIPEHPQAQPPAGINPAQQAQGYPMNPPSNYANPQQQQQQQQQPTLQQPATDPQIAGTRNPFFTTAPAAGAPAAAYPTATPQAVYQPTAGFGMSNRPATSTGGFPRGHMSQQSVDINGFQSGRHSPDAFASLSARYG
ncbi:putative GTPase activating protein for Arf [Aspergillus homomorphus CBS 101889]|uniref:ArfGap-domain-containing protein n=1 Tax=Aspergillus homomorphus (strain CBS 101889) TaxID=1450537 RepID=A0A395ID01_ASPHC|nr:ArfGap-domain-containing protein [Aspergillus homomorphus CBS 101889]RAL16044.1 ArfGap-domain-containing protein [Aspergillus homomorphus CBS 101889]